MSLTSLIKNPDVRKKFKDEFPRQPVPRKNDPIAPLLTNHYGLVGTAFDYLLRFYVKRLNPQAKTLPWVAEMAPAVLDEHIDRLKKRRSELGDKFQRLLAYNKTRHKKAQKILADADLLIDKMLIELKTTKELKVRRDSYNQLIGYYVLATIGGIDGVKRRHSVEKLSIYFSRFWT